MAGERLDQTQAHMDAFLRALAHRGPDGTGAYANGHVAFAHRRLSIIDLAGGAQPIHAENGDIIIVNGEIYNYLELKEELAGATFNTASDCEVALRLYQAEGESFVNRLRGMYALAIYDAAKDELLLHRDPFGIKPLYYVEQDGEVWFASEPQALFQQHLLAPDINADKAVEFLQLKFTTGRTTIFDGVKRVLPGETIVVRNGQIVRRSRQNPFASQRAATVSRKTASDTLTKELMDSVGVHVRSDVPYGVFLSGGVDSCSIVAAMAQIGLTGFPCYTARFPHAAVHDELELARKVAAGAGADHVEVVVSETDFWRTLPKVVTYVDDPVLDPAMVPFFLMAERASQDVKVVLTGAGGDEVFAGYRRYDRATFARVLPMRSLRTKGQFDASGLALFANNNRWRNGYAESEAAARANTRTPLQYYQATDGADYLPHFGLSLLDRCLMAHSVEGRTPLLDRELSRFAFDLPDGLKMRRFKGKWLLRKWLQEALPEAEPFARKRGFSVPVVEWVAARAPELWDFVGSQEGVRELFDLAAVERLFLNASHPKGGLRWPILFYALWHQTHIVRERPITLV